MTRIVRVSGAAQTIGGPDEVNYQIWLNTRDMDSIVAVIPMVRTGDDRKFIVIGTIP